VITRDDFNNWWSSPVAKEFKALLKENMETLAHRTMAESFARDNIATAVMVGQYEYAKLLLNIDYEYLMGVK